uniref:Reverse transcriptase domain-containing protein n=1 Tax=Astyanax mexicanus TaxID=7994 RepID=A0A3B1KIV4_ASTMX
HTLRSFRFKGRVKQGCPLSAALYVLSISPLIQKIKNNNELSGIYINGKRFIISAYADDITVIVKSRTELEIIENHFNEYEHASGAKLNMAKSEGSVDVNWNEKERIIKDEINQFSNQNLTYKARIYIIKTYILSKLLFLSCIFPPTEMWCKKINKLCINFIWGTTREVTKRDLVFKNRDLGGLGAIELGLKTKIAFCKIIANGLYRQAKWVGNVTKWKQKIKGKARTKVPYYQVIFSDFINRYESLNINWNFDSNKNIYGKISNALYGGPINYRDVNINEYQMIINNMKSKILSEKLRDIAWLTSVRRLPVRAVVKWSCYVKTSKCPMPNCESDETLFS